MVKKGEITGYSIGGSAERLEVGLDNGMTVIGEAE
jgi:hypothetical protein